MAVASVMLWGINRLPGFTRLFGKDIEPIGATKHILAVVKPDGRPAIEHHALHAIAGIEGGEDRVAQIQVHQPFVGAQPQVVIFFLLDGEDHIVGKSVGLIEYG